MSGKTLFVVTLEGRPAPIAIEAEKLEYYGDGLRFKNDGETVAAVPNVEFVARCDALGSATARAAGLLCEPPRALTVPPAMQFAELGVADIRPYAALFWSAPVCFGVGLVVGLGLTACGVLLS
ncbi:hypothetical protein [Pseudomonas hunanensis]|uniref:hypothetical protein n=1 Tax=Pseudomonas hunanensis TaxID=1247546 RepID=UPI0030D91D0E